MDILMKIKGMKLVDVFDLCSFFEDNRDDIDTILDVMILVYRDMLMVKSAGIENMLINSDKKDIIVNNVSRYSIQDLINNIEIVETTRQNIKQNANYQLSIEVMLMRLQEEELDG